MYFSSSSTEDMSEISKTFIDSTFDAIEKSTFLLVDKLQSIELKDKNTSCYNLKSSTKIRVVSLKKPALQFNF